MQRQLRWLLLLAAIVPAVVACARAAANDQLGGFAGDRWAVPPGPVPRAPYGSDAYRTFLGPPIPPGPATRPQAWPGTEAPPKQWTHPRSPVAGSEAVMPSAEPGWNGSFNGGHPALSPGGAPPGNAPPPLVARSTEYGPRPQPQLSAAAEMEPLEGTQILAKVGPYAILASEVMAGINELIERNKHRMTVDQLRRQSRVLIEQRLRQHVETKLIYHDARRTIPKENFPQVEKTLGEQFEKVELKNMMNRAQAQTPRELDHKLRTLGTSVERQKRAFIERTLSQQWVRQQINFNEPVTYDQMLEYYRRHLAEFEKPARARWEQLMVRFSKYPSEAEAHAAIARMGNQVLAGVPFAEVAKRRSDGPTAPEGGRRDWTTKGSLVCKALDEALFGLPVGRLSPILQGERGYHIVRVIEREEASCTPFLEAQADIEPKIRQQRVKQQLQAYLDRLKATTPVWTVFDQKPDSQRITLRPGAGPRKAATPGSAP